MALEPRSLYELQDGAYLPTVAAEGPWQQGVLHGGAVGTLLASLLDDPDQVVCRVAVELLGPVPSVPLYASIGATEGGRRVVRQSAELRANDRPVARAHALRMRRGDLELPASAYDHPVTFDPSQRPELSRPNRRAMKAIGRESFDSLAMALRWDDTATETPHRRRFWLKLLLPVLPDRPIFPIENVVAASDCAGSTASRLGFDDWTFMNADLVVGLGRPPSGDWIGLENDCVLGHTGTGLSMSALHDADGPLGHASQSVLLEKRR